MAKAGRPPLKFDPRQIRAFGRLGLTGVEMASLLGTTPETISHKMTNPDGEFFKAYHLGFSGLKKSLRHKQISLALAGSVPLLVWLGKQFLGQVDSPPVAVNVSQINTNLLDQPAIKEKLSRMHQLIREEASRHNGDGLPPRLDGLEG